MKYPVFILLFISATQLQAQTPAEKLLSDVQVSVSRRQSITYKAHCLFKFFDYPDTNAFTGGVCMQRVAKDTIFGGMIRYSTDDTFYKFYDKKKIYGVNHKGKTATSFDAAKGETWYMTGSIQYRTVWTGFLNPSAYNDLKAKENKLRLLSDTVYMGYDCRRMRIDFPDEEGFTDNRTILFINKADTIPVYKMNVIKSQGEYQYFQFSMVEYNFNAIPASTFSVKQIPASYKITAYKQDAEKKKILDTGTIAPSITGSNYNNNLKAETISFAGKVTILDFWYMGCQPCVLAMPGLQKIYEKYSGKPVRVIGLNSIDSSSDRIKKLPQFLEYNPVKYDMLFVSKDLLKPYMIYAFPTLYVIDKTGKIRYAIVGNSTDLEKQLTEVVDRLLRE